MDARKKGRGGNENHKQGIHVFMCKKCTSGADVQMSVECPTIYKR